MWKQVYYLNNCKEHKREYKQTGNTRTNKIEHAYRILMQCRKYKIDMQI